ncbi:MAG: type II toxin-antitoxin system Phd/YefM family antitoxin [Candidatus Binatia bacterium]
MISVGIRELKNNLSHYLRDVKKGKPITVTERGKSIAILIPARNHPDAQIARELSRKGVGSWKGGKPKGGSRPVVVKGKPVSQIVVEERR